MTRVRVAALFAKSRHNGPPWRGLLRFAALCVVLFSAGIGARVSYAQELPLERCDVLPMIEVQVASLHKWFLVDTAATSMLNLESFTAGHARDIHVTSWSGTLDQRERSDADRFDCRPNETARSEIACH